MTAPDPPRGKRPERFITSSDGTRLAVDDVGEASGKAVLLLHGLTAHRGLVLMGSRLLEKSGHRVVSFDARGHGWSDPAGAGGYGYRQMAEDAQSVIAALDLERPLVAGVSMGAHTAVSLASTEPGLVGQLLLITPAWTAPAGDAELKVWDRRAAALRESGLDGFVAALDIEALDPRWRETAASAARQRMEHHRHPAAVADALREVPRSNPVSSLDELRRIDVPTTVVGSRDSSDPGHPLAVARLWAELLPQGQLEVEGEGESPLAWRGGAISRLVADLLSRA